jgi:NADH:ubiquinone oxidoreductase subunit 2 (subunit N)
VPLALWGIGTSAVSVFYYLRVALLMYTRPPADEPAYNWSRTSLPGGGVLLLTTAGTLVLGIFVSLVWNVAVAAQHGILPSSLL